MQKAGFLMTRLNVACAFIFRMCQARITDLRRLTTPATTAPLLHSCGEDWTHFNGHCYLVVKEYGKTWDEASAYLVEITPKAELEFAAQLIHNYKYAHFWIGATDRAEEGRFVYQNSKQEVSEEYWGEGEPNNYRGNQHCAFMWSGWADGLEFYDESCYYYNCFCL